MATNGKKTQNTVRAAVHKQKAGTLKSGRSGKTVTNRKQAIAIGLSEARHKGTKAPSKNIKSATKSTKSMKSRGCC